MKKIDKIFVSLAIGLALLICLIHGFIYLDLLLEWLGLALFLAIPTLIPTLLAAESILFFIKFLISRENICWLRWIRLLEIIFSLLNVCMMMLFFSDLYPSLSNFLNSFILNTIFISTIALLGLWLIEIAIRVIQTILHKRSERCKQ